MPEGLTFPFLHKNPDSPKNWTEDFTHENGQYSCWCSRCRSSFIGHKRRILCKECAKTPSGHIDQVRIVSVLGEGQKQLDQEEGLHLRYVAAWLEETGLLPSECEVVTKHLLTETVTFIRKRLD